MGKRISLLVVVSILAAGVAAFAQNIVPKVDGTVEPSEYAQTYTDNGVVISSQVTPDRIYMAITAPGDGWVALGLGSSVMNGATIFMGYVDTNGKPEITVQKGRFHTHSEFSGETPIAQAVGESNGKTTLEIAINRADFLDAGQKTMNYIFAYNKSAKDFRTRHTFRNSSTLKIE
ncbi:MAG TPA: hypothetical protein VMW87_03870 [Spirochaetia bacterium]|nr:hypothetical protein [Spirochaetia bacterium]